jgi:16S rRNA processing protein RimM
MSDLIVARVRRPHGVLGEVLISVDTDRPRHVIRPGRILHLGDSRGEPTGRTVTLEKMRPTTGGAILRLEGIATRDAAASIHGATLLIEGSEAAPANADEVHYRDLIGLTAVADGRELGKVEDLLEIRMNQLLVIRGPDRKEILIPFISEMVEQVDVARGELRLKLPEGLLEL